MGFTSRETVRPWVFLSLLVRALSHCSRGCVAVIRIAPGWEAQQAVPERGEAAEAAGPAPLEETAEAGKGVMMGVGQPTAGMAAGAGAGEAEPAGLEAVAEAD